MSSSSSTSRATTTTTLSEQTVQDAFHSYLKSSLTQAKLERLLDADILSSAEGDLMITGPALCLYFAALRSTTNPPSVPLPRSSKSSSSSSSSTGPTDLSYENCPPKFAPFLQVWASTVPHIQSFVPEQQHDLARIICDLPPLSPHQNVNPKLYGIAAELRAIALEISQRRSFQDRYASDLQAALDASEDGGKKRKKKASFVPPPVYDAVPPPPPPSSSTSTPTTSAARASWSPSSASGSGSRSGSGSGTSRSPSPPWDKNRPLPPRPLAVSKKPTIPTPAPPSRSSSTAATDTPTILTPISPAIEFIRETLYAALGDVLDDHPTLLTLLKTDPPRAYFASVSLAILFVATQAIDQKQQAVIGVLGTPLALSQCPEELKPLMRELMAIGAEAKVVEEEDDQLAMRRAQRGEEEESGRSLAQSPSEEARMDRVRKILVEGVGYEMRRGGGGDRRSLEGRAVGFATRIGELALKMTGLSAFRERQDMVFKVLAGIGGV